MEELSTALSRNFQSLNTLIDTLWYVQGDRSLKVLQFLALINKIIAYVQYLLTLFLT